MGDTAVIPLTLLPGRTDTTRIGRDRLELLTALIEASAFAPLFRDTLIFTPPQHPVYAWQCAVDGCLRIRRISHNLCNTHNLEWKQAERTGQTKRAFMDAATPLPAAREVDYGQCLICPDRPAISPTTRLCQQHQTRWQYGEAADTDRSRFEYWARTQHPLPGYGLCQARCPFSARTSLGLCLQHLNRYSIDNRPGTARSHHSRGPLKDGRPLPVTYVDEKAFRAWCATAEPVTQPRLVNLHALPPLLRAEIQWGLHAHAQYAQHSEWTTNGISNLVRYRWRGSITSLMDLHDEGYKDLTRKHMDSEVRKIIREIVNGLRCVYYSSADTKDAGFLETDHFGRRFKSAQSHFDITTVPQRWLRDLLWDHLAQWLRSPQCPRTRGPFDQMRRAAVELGLSLQADAPDAGHDPTVLRREHAEQFARRPAPPRPPRPAVPGHGPGRRTIPHRHRPELPIRLQPIPQAALQCHHRRPRRTPRHRHRLPDRHPLRRHRPQTAFPQPLQRRRRPRADGRDQPAAPGRTRPQRPWPAGHLKDHRRHRARHCSEVVGLTTQTPLLANGAAAPAAARPAAHRVVKGAAAPATADRDGPARRRSGPGALRGRERCQEGDTGSA